MLVAARNGDDGGFRDRSVEPLEVDEATKRSASAKARPVAAENCQGMCARLVRRMASEMLAHEGARHRVVQVHKQAGPIAGNAVWLPVCLARANASAAALTMSA